MHPDERRRSLIRAVRELSQAVELLAGRRLDLFPLVIFCITEVNAGRATIAELEAAASAILQEAEITMLGEVLP